MVAPIVIGAAILAIANKLFDIMQTVSFMMFIEEEGLQIRGFGIMSLIREKLTDEVEAQLGEMRIHTTNLETLCDSWGWIAPYMKPTYERYIQATWDQIDAWDAWVISIRTHWPKFGIRIVSSPSNASIFVNGRDTHQLTPHTITKELLPGLHEGQYTFRLEYTSIRRGELFYEEEVFITEDRIQEFRWILEEV